MSISTKDEAKGLFQKSVKLISELAAIVVSFFLTGPLFTFSVPFVSAFARDQYGEGIDGLVEIFWFVIIGLGTYAIARATVATLIMVGGTALMVRLF
jgi:uncharacterized membrane protein